MVHKIIKIIVSIIIHCMGLLYIPIHIPISGQNQGRHGDDLGLHANCGFRNSFLGKLLIIWKLLSALISISYNCCSKVPPTGWIKLQKLIVPQFWGLEVKVSAGLVLSHGYDRNSVPYLSPSCCWFAGNLWHSVAWGMHHPISAFILTWHSPCVGVSVSRFLLFIRMPVMLD